MASGLRRIAQTLRVQSNAMCSLALCIIASGRSGVRRALSVCMRRSRLEPAVVQSALSARFEPMHLGLLEHEETGLSSMSQPLVSNIVVSGSRGDLSHFSAASCFLVLSGSCPLRSGSDS